MNFLKQVLFLLVLVAPITCMPVTISDKPSIMSMISDDRKQDIISIVKVIGKTVESELTSINFDDNADKENRAVSIDIDLAKAEQFLQQKLSVIVAKVSNAVKHDLTKKQQTIVIDLLHNLQSFFSFTKDELVKMTKAGEGEKDIPEEIKEKIEELINKLPSREEYPKSREEYLLMTKGFEKEVEKIDFHNEPYNLLMKLISRGYVFFDLAVIARIDLSSDKTALPLQKCCEYLVGLSDVLDPEVFFGCQCMSESWEKAYAKVADIFCVVNRLSSALLKSIENQ